MKCVMRASFLGSFFFCSLDVFFFQSRGVRTNQIIPFTPIFFFSFASIPDVLAWFITTTVAPYAAACTYTREISHPVRVFDFWRNQRTAKNALSLSRLLHLLTTWPFRMNNKRVLFCQYCV